MIKEAIEKIVLKEDLTYDEAYAVMNAIMNGETTPTQNAAFLAALSTKSTKAETIDEISGCAQAMREHALTVDGGERIVTALQAKAIVQVTPDGIGAVALIGGDGGLRGCRHAEALQEAAEYRQLGVVGYLLSHVGEGFHHILYHVQVTVLAGDVLLYHALAVHVRL